MGTFAGLMGAGEVLWCFRWKGHGMNSVMAKSREEALAKATEMGASKEFDWGGTKQRTVTLTPDPKTLTNDRAICKALMHEADMMSW